MCVKRLLEVDIQQKMYGNIDLGTNSTYDGDDIPLVKNSLVFLIVGMNGYWKLSIGYFLIDGLNGQERGNLLKIAIDIINNTGAHLHSITFDGAYSNGKMCSNLGASFDINDELSFSFENPYKDEPIYVFMMLAI